jgi:hypothetical protein
MTPARKEVTSVRLSKLTGSAEWIDSLLGSPYLPGEWPEDYGTKVKVPDLLVDQLVYPLRPEPSVLDRAEAAARETDERENRPGFSPIPTGFPRESLSDAVVNFDRVIPPFDSLPSGVGKGRMRKTPQTSHPS